MMNLKVHLPSLVVEPRSKPLTSNNGESFYSLSPASRCFLSISEGTSDFIPQPPIIHPNDINSFIFEATMGIYYRQVHQLIGILSVILLFSSCEVKKSGEGNPFSVSGEHTHFPKPAGYINDFEEVLTDSQEKILTGIIKAHERVTGDQIAVVTLKSVEPYYNIDDYSLALANYWGVGQKDKNNGVLIAISTNSKTIRVQNGYGIEQRLTDNETKRILDNIIIPELKKDNYFEGIKGGIEAFIKELS